MPRSSRPLKDTQIIEDQIIKFITQNYISRSFLGREISIQVRLSDKTIQRVLKRRGYQKVKPTVKPGLIATIIEARYHFAIRYKD